MILVLEDRYESPLSIDTKKVPVALHLTSQWRFNDVRVTKNWILRILDEKRPNFKFLQKILGICDFDGGFWLIVKGNNYYNIHRKFQVHSNKYFCIGAKTNIARWQPPPLPLWQLTLPLPKGRVVKFFALKWPKRMIPQLAALIWW